MRKLLMTLASVALFTAASATFAADTAPKSVIHVVTVSWKADATPAQIQAALDDAEEILSMGIFVSSNAPVQPPHAALHGLPHSCFVW